MDDPDRYRRWSNLKQRLGLKGIGFCGSTWTSTTSPSTLSIIETEEAQQENHHRENHVSALAVAPTSAASIMNLAMALAAERNLRTGDLGPNDSGNVKSLMRLFEETDGVDWKKTIRKDNKDGDNDWVCCVCMEKSKGAAFIPCGHAFCRVCSRELWINRGSCPICNRSIIEILDIY